MVTIPAQYEGDVEAAASITGLPEAVIAAQINDESGWNPDALSPTGAQGIAQFEPGTWAEYGTGSPDNPADAFPAYDAYMASLIKGTGGDVAAALSEYNSGSPTFALDSYAYPILSAAGVAQNLTVTPGSGAAADLGTTAQTLSFPGGGLDPLNWAQEVEQKAESDITGAFAMIWQSFEVWSASAAVVVVGAALVLWGLGRATGAGQRAVTVIENTAGAAGSAAGAGAALAA
jgi:hypothetical protein